MLTMMVGANVTSSQLVSIAERMLLETDLDQVTFVGIGIANLAILFGIFGEACPHHFGLIFGELQTACDPLLFGRNIFKYS